MLYWLLPSPRRLKSNRLAMKEGGFLGVAGDNWGRMEALQQRRQPPVANPPSPDSIDTKISAFINVTFISSRSSTVRTLDRRTSWAPRRNNTIASAPSFKEPPLPSAHHPIGSGWHHLNNHTLEPLRSWVLTLKELHNLIPSFMYIMLITMLNLSIPDVLYPAILSTLIRRQL